MIVPGDNETLRKVRLYVGNAFLASDRRGVYINAGMFGNREAAESVSHYLRSLGFDARVEYF